MERATATDYFSFRQVRPRKDSVFLPYAGYIYIAYDMLAGQAPNTATIPCHGQSAWQDRTPSPQPRTLLKCKSSRGRRSQGHD